jgi:uncharacterized membrane protein HdeD (DUF308 family)
MAADVQGQQFEGAVVGIPGKVVWQLELIVGIITFGLGIALAFHPSTSLKVVSIFIGILLVIGGLFHFVRALDRDEDHRAWAGIAGVVEVVLGVVMIRHFHVSVALIALLVGLSWIIQGIVALLAGILGGARGSRIWPILFGLISLIAGIVVVAYPVKSVTVLATLLGIWFLIIGLLEILGGFFLRHDLKKVS